MTNFFALSLSPGRIPDDGKPDPGNCAALYYGCQDWSQVLKYSSGYKLHHHLYWTCDIK